MKIRTFLKLVFVIIILFMFITNNYFIYAEIDDECELVFNQYKDNMNKQIEYEVNKQVKDLKDGVIEDIEKKNSTFITYVTILLSIVAIAVAVWAALGIINAINYRKISQLEKMYETLKHSLEVELKLHENYINKSKLQEKKLVTLSIFTLPIIQQKFLKYILNDKLDSFISYTEVDKLITETSLIFTRGHLKQKVESGESRQTVVNGLLQRFDFLRATDTENGFVFTIKDEEYKELYVEVVKELLKNNITS